MGRKRKEDEPSRDGRIKKNGDAPAEHVPGGAAAPVQFDPKPIVEAMKVYWTKGDQFVMPVADGRWAVFNQQACVDRMIKVANGMGHIMNPQRVGAQVLANTKETLDYIRDHRFVDHIFDGLPGYPKGLYVLPGGKWMLIKTAPGFAVPTEGEWPLIRTVLENLLNAEPVLRQMDFMYSWLKVGAESVMRGRPGNWRPGHGVIMAGPAASGKGFVQEHIMTPLLGGRQADPEKMLFQKDEYNSDCWSAEHLALGEVPNPSQRTHDRVALSEKLKQIVANTQHRMRVMREDPLALFPFWRLSISVNDHPDKLRNLPLITDDIRDKVIIFHCRKMGMPMPTRSIDERIAFSDAIAAEMPHFLHWLLNVWVIPEDLLRYENGEDATRFGFREFHHPIIKESMFADTPDAQFIDLVDQAEFTSHDWSGARKLWELPAGSSMNAMAEDDRRAGHVWHERAATLQQLLTGEGGCMCSIATLAKKSFAHNNCAWMLGRLAKDEVYGQRIEKGDVTAWRGWRIARPAVPAANGGV